MFQAHVTYLTEAHHCIERSLFVDDVLHVLVGEFQIAYCRHRIEAIVRPWKDLATTLCSRILIVGIEKFILEVLGEE